MENYKNKFFLNKKILNTIYITFVFIFVTSLIYSTLFGVSQDFYMYLTGGTLAKNGNIIQLYDIKQQELTQSKLISNTESEKLNVILPFRYLPIFTYLFVPLTYIHKEFYPDLIAIINSVLILLGTLLSNKIFEQKSKKVFFIIASAVALSPFTFFVTLNSHFAFIYFFVSLIIYLTKRNKDALAGIACTLLCIKLHYLIIIPLIFFIAQRKSKFFRGLVAGVTLMLLANLLIYGPSLPMDYLKFVLSTEKPIYGSNPKNMFSLFSLLSSTTNTPIFLNIVVNIIFYGAILTTFIIISSKVENKIDSLMSVLTFIPLFFIHTYGPDLVLLNIPLIYLLLKKRFYGIFLYIFGYIGILEYIDSENYYFLISFSLILVFIHYLFYSYKRLKVG